MTDLNPYAAPQADTGSARAPEAPSADGLGVWRDGDLLVVRRDMRLPDICLKTNGPAEYRLTYNLSWHPPALYLAFLFPPALLIAPLFVYQARVEVPVCELVYRHKRRDQWVSAGCLVLGLLALAAPLAQLPIPLWMILAGPILIIASIGYIQDTTFVGAKRIEAGKVWVSGACPEYLARWPDIPHPGK